MKKSFLALALVTLAPCIFAVETDALLNSLSPRGDLSDFAQVFAVEQKAGCESILREIREKTSAEIAVVTLPSLEGGEINDFASRLFQKWGIGKRDEDNGILLLVAVKDRKARIEVGYGLEGILPDAKAGRILDTAMLPYFREENYAGGIINGVGVIAQIIAQDAGIALTSQTPAEAVSASTPDPAPARKAGLAETVFFIFIICIFLFFFIWALVNSARRSKGGRKSSGGGFFGSGGGGGSSGGGFGGGSSGGGGASRGW